MEWLVNLMNQVNDKLNSLSLSDIYSPAEINLADYSWLLQWAIYLILVAIGYWIRFRFIWKWQIGNGINVFFMFFIIMMGWFSISGLLFGITKLPSWMLSGMMSYIFLVIILILFALKLMSIGFFLGVLVNYIDDKTQNSAARLEKRSR